MNYYRHHIGDYLRDTAHLSMLEDAAYRRLLDLYYMRERSIPADHAAVCRLVRAREDDERSAVRVVLEEFFTLESDGWHQKRADGEIALAEGRAETARTNGKAGGRPRKTGKQPEPPEKEPEDNPEETNPVISGIAEDNPEENSPSSNHQPLVTTVTEVAREAQSFDVLACPSGIHAEAWADWAENRRIRRKPISARAAVDQWRALACLSPPQQAACIAHSIRNDYQGLFPEKFGGEPHASNQPGRSARADTSAAGRVRANVKRELDTLAAARAGGDGVAAHVQPIRPQVG